MLPKLSVSTFEVVIPSTKETIKMRRFLVKEEKLLLMALESGEENEALLAVQDILRSCIVDEIKTKKFTTYDIEYLFLKLRIRSVGEVVKVSMVHPEGSGTDCNEITEVEIDLDTIQVHEFPEHDPVIKLEQNIGMKLRDPDSDLLKSIKEGQTDIDQFASLVFASVECVYNGEEVIHDFTEKEFSDWFETFNDTQLQMLKRFFDTVPSLQHTVNFTCKCGKSEIVTLVGLQSFFT